MQLQHGLEIGDLYGWGVAWVSAEVVLLLIASVSDWDLKTQLDGHTICTNVLRHCEHNRLPQLRTLSVCSRSSSNKDQSRQPLLLVTRG
jgi:hypothetical protein